MSYLHSTPVYGLYYFYQNRVVSLPLLGVRADASIKELAAQVKLTQTYGNDATFPIEAKYTFPIPARASVCSFVMIKQDGTRVVGSVLEKQEAREMYNTSVAHGQQASLVEQQTPDVFQVSVGNIPPDEQVQIELVYATELSEDEENDSIRFHLPVHIGARYGQGPQSKPTPSSFRGTVFISSSSPTPFLTLAMSVEAIAPISKIGCPSHTVSTELGPDPKLPNFKELPFSNYARVSLSSDSPLDKDFVLTIKSAGLDTPRCIAEVHPSHDTVALGLTLVPRFKLPDLSRQEFVFIVDRSGSMGGKRIEAARKALVIMLRALPHENSLFQVISFGSRTSSLWAQGSKPYNQGTLEEATRHVDAMDADYGGTEIAAALQHCFRARKLDRPLSVLMLTDGDAWDLGQVLGEVKSAVVKAPKDAYVRVSVLGIGNSVSTAMCEGMARVGNGVCMLVGEEETTFTGKIARMLKVAKTPPISNISVDWGRPSPTKEKAATPPDYDDFEMVEEVAVKEKKKETLNIFDESIDDPIQVDSTPAPPPPPVVLPAFPPVQQAPFTIENLFPNIRLNVYAILQGKTIPKTVTIRGTSASGASIELPITVALSHLQNTPGAPPALHALAARKILQDLEDGKHALATTLANPDDSDLLKRTVKASVVRLGKTYSVVSTHTSFVAVDESKPESMQSTGYAPAYVVTAPPPMASLSGGGGARYRRLYDPSSVAAPVAMSIPPFPSGQTARGRISHTTSGLPKPRPAPASVAPGAAPLPPPAPIVGSSVYGASYSTPAPQSSVSFGSAQSDLMSLDFGESVTSSAAVATTGFSVGSAASHSRASIFTSATPTSGYRGSSFGSTLNGAHATFGSAAPPQQFQQQQSNYTPLQSTYSRSSNAPQSTDPLEALARLQSFDGCFSLEVFADHVIALKPNVDIHAMRAVFPAGASDGVIASVLAMAFLANKLGAGVDRDSWEGIYEKAQQYVEVALQKMGVTETAEGLEAKVVAFLA
ncbi:von Willebrand factor type A domain-containing protein [Mycena haematopus]|nr:von Willebrand factor type A domain-containing protein [Mycena haematopus]